MNDIATTFDSFASAAAEQLMPLRGSPIHVNGASGFLASNLIALLDRASALGGLGLRLHASARRPQQQVSLFRFLGLDPQVRWERAPAETTILPDLGACVAIHTASYGAPADYLSRPLEMFRANTEGLIRTFQEAARIGATHVVYLSSAEVYGQPTRESIPTPEDYVGGPDLGDVRSIYAESKRMAEVLGAALSRETGIPFTAVRPWNLYGPGQRLEDGRVPAALMRMAIEDGHVRLSSDGTPRRSVCFVWDGLLQLAACLDPAGANGGPVNIGNPDDERSIAELARGCAAAAGLSPERVLDRAPWQCAGAHAVRARHRARPRPCPDAVADPHTADGGSGFAPRLDPVEPRR